MGLIRSYNKHNSIFSCADYTIIDLYGNEMAMTTEDLIAKMENARNQLNDTLDKVPQNTEIYPTWKIKQLLDHISGWDVLVAAAFRAHSRGETLGRVARDGIDQYNADSVKARKSLSFAESRQAYDDARADVIRAMREMPEEKLTEKFKPPWGGMCTVANVVRIFVSHEIEHAEQIENSIKISPETG
jgi:hypothetical protein